MQSLLSFARSITHAERERVRVQWALCLALSLRQIGETTLLKCENMINDNCKMNI